LNTKKIQGHEARDPERHRRLQEARIEG